MTFECYLCKNKNYEVVATKSQIRFECYGYNKEFVRCSKCGLVQLNPHWTDDETDFLYNKYSLKKDFLSYKPKKEIRHYIDDLIVGKKRILEIGCSVGNDLMRHRNRGYNIIGIDRDPSVCDNKIILNYSFENFVSSTQYDFIYSIHVFEHVKNPNYFIEMLKKNLSPGGEFVLEIPSVEDPLLSLYNNIYYKNFYWYPFHAYYYSQKTIRELFKKHNITVDVSLIQRYGILNHLRWIIFRRPGNWHPHVPVIDAAYKFFISKIIGVSDTMLVRWKND